ncbi:MAG TPA: DUF1287 domain-containing protein [Aridibacter sp.]|nr:DUF1287 domain-containing protein [Aridibacter sp.]
MKFPVFSPRLLPLLVLVISASCAAQTRVPDVPETRTEIRSPKVRKVIESARKQLDVTTGYTQKYFTIDYPNGDVPEETGACTDVVIRAFRNAGSDQQKEVHEDMKKHFASYPKKWGLKTTDTNIDHRRVPNLRRFFERKGKSLPVSTDHSDYLPGDIVTWDLDGNGMTHIGIVSDAKDPSTGRHLIIHNIGGGVQEENRLFEWEITGRYRYFE